MKWLFLSVCVFLKSFAILALVYCFLIDLSEIQKRDPLDDFKGFLKDWSRFRQIRMSLDSVIGSCKDQIKWESRRPGAPSDAAQSFIASWDLKPAGEFSRFFITAVSRNGQRRTTGGDWWRVLIRGTASMEPAVFDFGNGTYEVLFLPVEPGTYDVNIVLDYTLCDGFRDPPDDWFIIGNSQGKMQPEGVLKGHGKDDYLHEPLQGGRKLMINIRLPSTKGLYMFNTLPKKILTSHSLDLRREINCSLVWDGYGRWNAGKWNPYLKPKPIGQDIKKSSVVNKLESPSYETLWMYGDFQALRMYNEVRNTKLCQAMFKSCKMSMCWVYFFQGKRPPNDQLDFDYRRITKDIKKVIELPEMSGNSVMVLNLGLHYLMSTNFSNYVKLLRSVVHLFKGNAVKDGRSVRMIWKTTTPVSKEKDTKTNLHTDRKRFLNNPRVAMFNAYATSLMCREGFEVLDVYPLMGSYPHGAGGPNIEYYKEHDIVHFEPHVAAPFQEVLMEYLTGKLPELSFEEYELS